jgi:phage recombination protein Bet
MAEQKKTQEVMARPEERAVVYTAADGQEVRLTFDIVKKYLVQGNSDMITVQELMYFLNICRARRLNPLTKDCYLIKYSADPAAIVTSIDFFRKRARIQKDCVGWQKGIIVRGKDGKLRDSFGLVDEGETLVGGWFEAQPTGWTKPFRLEVNLSGYIKKTKEGAVTRFWQPENQPTMIAKVGEAQGLRTLWPDEFQAIFTAEEGAVPVFEIPEAIDLETHGRFEELIAGMKFSPDEQKLFEQYCEYQAKKNKVSIEDLQGMAERDFKNFMEYFKVFKTKAEGEAKSKTPITEKEKGSEKPGPHPPEEKKEEDKNPPGASTGQLFAEKEMRGEGEKPTK